MNRFFRVLPVLFVLIPLNSKSVTYSETRPSDNPGVSIELADPMGSVYQEGEAVRLAVRTDRDAYVLVYDIDTDGFVHLLYPRDAESLQKIPAGEVVAIPERTSEKLLVAGNRGMEFVFAVAVAERDEINDREIGFMADDAKRGPKKGFRIDGDPFLGANRVARQLIRGARYGTDVGMAYTYFYIGEAVDFPRYLCQDCYESGRDPYASSATRYSPTTAFDHADHLAYPLQVAFGAPESADDLFYTNEGSGSDRGLSYGKDTTTHVYVSYYPRWDYGYYYEPYLYYDPWYYPSGFYWSIGFNWGWGPGWGWGWGYYPSYYYCYPYYGHHWYNYPYYHYPTPYHGYGGDYVAHRNERFQGKVRYRSELYNGMTAGNDTGVRYRTASTSNAMTALGKTTTRAVRPLVAPAKKHASSKVQRDVRVIRSKPSRAYAGNGAKTRASEKSGRVVNGQKTRRANGTYQKPQSGKSRSSSAVKRSGSQSRGKSVSKAPQSRSGSSGRAPASTGKSKSGGGSKGGKGGKGRR